MLRRWKRAERAKVDGSGTKESSQSNCSDGSKVHGDRRLRSIRTLQVLLLKPAILRLFPGLLNERGYTRTVLRVSPTDIQNGFSFVKASLFQDSDREKIDKATTKVKNTVVLKKLQANDNDTGKRTLIIEHQAQIGSLGRLLS